MALENKRFHVTGHDEIDGQHQAVFVLIKELGLLCDDLHTKADCRACSSSLVDGCLRQLLLLLESVLHHLVHHFSYEESLMKQAGLLGVARETCHSHMEDHGVITELVRKIIDDLGSNNTVQLIRRLEGVLLTLTSDHVLDHDLALVEALAAAGLVRSGETSGA